MKFRKINIQTISIMLLEIILVIIIFLLDKSSTTKEILSKIGFVSIICMFISTIFTYKLFNKINFFLCFIVLSYLFAFGQSMLIYCGIELPNSPFSISFSGFTVAELKISALYTSISICMVVIGGGLVKTNYNFDFKFKPDLQGEIKLCKLGWVLLFISILPTFYLLYQEALTTFNTGYGATLVSYSGVNRILSLISGFFTSAILIIFCFEKNKNQRRFFYIIIIAYCILQVIGGSRISVFRLGIVFFIISNLFLKSLNKKKVILIIIMALMGSFIFSVVSAARIYLYNISDISVFIKQTIEHVWNDNFIILSIREMGNTQIINTLVHSKCPSVIDYHYGLSLFKMIWGIFPNILGDSYTGHIGVDITFSELYNKTNSGLGASYLSEGYWNFGMFSMIYFIFYGFFLSKIEQYFCKGCNSIKMRATTFFLIVYVIYYMIFMVRGELIGFGRSFVYYALIPVLLCNLIKRKD